MAAFELLVVNELVAAPPTFLKKMLVRVGMQNNSDNGRQSKFYHMHAGNVLTVVEESNIPTQ